MQIIVFTKETGKLVLHSGPIPRNDNKIVEIGGITDAITINNHNHNDKQSKQ